MATKKSISKPSTSKKDYKKDLAGKIESALPELKTRLGDKKFQHRINKAAKLLVHGLHTKDLSATNGKPKTTAEIPAKNIKAAKKAKVKKQATAIAN